MVYCMNRYIALILLTVVTNTANAEVVSFVQDRSGVAYLPNDDEPFSGEFTSVWALGHGQYRESGTYRNGKKSGVWTEWYINGQKKSETSYKDNQPDGVRRTWNEDGQQLFEATYKDNKINGQVVSWHKNGIKQFEKFYKDGIADGKWTEWYEDGQIQSETNYKDGIEDGVWREWFADGQQRTVGMLKNGKADGLAESWYENGNKRYEIRTKDGKKKGLEIRWDLDGNKVLEVVYPIEESTHKVSVGLFSDYAIAEGVRDNLVNLGYDSVIKVATCSAPTYSLQLMLWSELEYATDHKNTLENAGVTNVYIVPLLGGKRTKYQVNVGRFNTAAEAYQKQQFLDDKGYDSLLLDNKCFTVKAGEFTFKEATQTKLEMVRSGITDITIADLPAPYEGVLEQAFVEIGKPELQRESEKVGLTGKQNQDYMGAIGVGFAYRSKMRLKLNALTIYPKTIAEEYRIGGRVVVRFVLNRAGELLSIEIVESSGHKVLDDAVMDMIKIAQPFDSLPDNMKNDRVAFAFPLTIKLQDR